MILFIAPNPHKVKDREGFLQRVMAIDNLFLDAVKVYSDDLENEMQLAQAMNDAELIYVHSIYNSNKIVRSYKHFTHKIITDLHGVVPEEELYADNMEMHKVTEYTENEVFKYGKYFIAVTNVMMMHFKKKYSMESDKTWCILPIFDELKSIETGELANSLKDMVIYAGGSQRWQNVGLMTEAINATFNYYKFLILTHSPDSFDRISDEARKNTIIKTVQSDEIINYYKQASMGFVLRDEILLNSVACPTKLIEYLRYGVVPIVLSEQIGDFKELGYQYISIKEFLDKKIAKDRIVKAASINLGVYKRLVKVSEIGKKQLLKTCEEIKKTDKSKKQSINNDLLVEEFLSQSKINDILRYEYQIGEYHKKVKEYAHLAET